MGFAKIQSVALAGLEAVPVSVEVDVHSYDDKLSVVMVGLPDTAVRESKDRVMAAIRNSGYSFPPVRCTVNFAPADTKKEGVVYDLPVAIGMLYAQGVLSPKISVEDYIIVGELGLNGDTRMIHGALAAAILARETGKKGILLPALNAKEASAVPGLQVIPILSLKQAVEFLRNPNSTITTKEVDALLFANEKPLVDFLDIKGQLHVKRAMEIAASGGHNVIMTGPPGSGKTMLAKALLGIMPPLTMEEALETTKIHSVAGLLPEGQSLVLSRPFRSPHHTVSHVGLVGGGTNPRPGEISLAHNGILFLDELPEFSRMALEVLRQPLEDRKVTISRANGSYTFPTNIMCIAAMNPCPCGFLGSTEKRCKDTELQVEKYKRKISGPFWDRMDMHIEVPSLRYKEIVDHPHGETSKDVQKRVLMARKRQMMRYKGTRTNAQMTTGEMKEYCTLGADGHEVMRNAMDVMGVSARGNRRILLVARTLADMEGEQDIQKHHLMEAISYRTLTLK